MKPLEAAGEFWSVVDEVEAHRPIARRFDAACKVLKEYMVDKQLDTYQGIRLVESPGGKRLDLDSARAKFGDKLESCFVDSVRRSLIKVKRPARHAKA